MTTCCGFFNTGSVLYMLVIMDRGFTVQQFVRHTHTQRERINQAQLYSSEIQNNIKIASVLTGDYIFTINSTRRDIGKFLATLLEKANSNLH